MTLKEAKIELKNAWIPGEGYDYDQTYVVCYKDGTCLDTRTDGDKRLPLTGIIGIQFNGSDDHYAVGKELFKGELIDIICEE